MALPNIMRRLFRNDGYGPLLKPEIIPFALDLASSDGSVAASTQWVKDLAVASVYVDPAGSDANDGMSSASAVQTFAKAIQIASALPQNRIKIVSASGAYTGDIGLDGDLNCEIELQGTTSISGNILVENNSSLTVSGSYQLSVLGVVRVFRSSALHSLCPITITSSSSSLCLAISTTSTFSGTDISIVSNGTPNEIISVELGSSLIASGNISITGTASTHAISVRNQSICYVVGNITIGDIGEAGWTIGSLYSSWMVCSGNVDIYGGPNSLPLNVQRLSGIQIEGRTKIRTASRQIVCQDKSYCSLNGLDFSARSALGSAIEVMGASLMYISDLLSISGTFTSRVVYVNMNSVFQLYSSATVTNNATGARYYAATGGQILVSGAGANRLPGSIAGNVSSASYGYYG